MAQGAFFTSLNFIPDKAYILRGDPMKASLRIKRLGAYCRVLPGVLLFFGAALPAEAGAIIEETFVETALSLGNESRAAPSAAAAGSTFLLKDSPVIMPEPGTPASAPRAGDPLGAGRRLSVTEESAADGHKVERHLAGDPRRLGRQAITRSSGRKVYRYYSGRLLRDPDDKSVSESAFNPAIVIKHDSGPPRAKPGRP